MSTANIGSRLGPFDIADDFKSGLLLILGLNAVQFAVFSWAPVISSVSGLFAPLVGFTQLLYAAPLIAEFTLIGKKKAAMGVAAGAALTLVITIIRLIASPWGEEAFYGDEY